jgi:hypothetical protein
VFTAASPVPPTYDPPPLRSPVIRSTVALAVAVWAGKETLNVMCSKIVAGNMLTVIKGILEVPMDDAPDMAD